MSVNERKYELCINKFQNVNPYIQVTMCVYTRQASVNYDKLFQLDEKLICEQKSVYKKP